MNSLPFSLFNLKIATTPFMRGSFYLVWIIDRVGRRLALSAEPACGGGDPTAARPPGEEGLGALWGAGPRRLCARWSRASRSSLVSWSRCFGDPKQTKLVSQQRTLTLCDFKFSIIGTVYFKILFKFNLFWVWDWLFIDSFFFISWSILVSLMFFIEPQKRSSSGFEAS